MYSTGSAFTVPFIQKAGRSYLRLHSLMSCAVQNIFADAGVEWKWYRYFKPETVGLDFEGLMEDLRGAPEGSVVVLHGETAGLAMRNPLPASRAAPSLLHIDR